MAMHDYRLLQLPVAVKNPAADRRKKDIFHWPEIPLVRFMARSCGFDNGKLLTEE